MKEYTIYLITDDTNNKPYIGQTTQSIKKRWEAHRYGKGYLGSAIRAHGIQHFKMVEIDYASSQEQANRLERLYIEMYNSMAPNGYNLTDGGTGNYKVSSVTKLAIKEKASTLERKQKVSDTAMRTWQARRRNELEKEQLLAACNCMDCNHWHMGSGDKACLSCYKYTESYSPTGETEVIEFEVIPDTIIESIADDKENKTILDKINSLPIELSAIMLMKFYGKMKIGEMAKVIGRSDTAVDRRIKQGMKMLNQLLKQ